ncbi:hypothetical protein QBC40DRAFT_272664 [Triangularia verruculosa]|uniref:Uncharacterized protein n=1 Tax=Triangularia verruculosa TaxID=2587418 RepID=A0AAN6XQB5_9PEZI|nr:hypothetical protein QBC40DRAFT_272664 [Triangularia verruculosa]
MEANAEPKSLQRLLAEPKGKITFLPGQAFLLHVFWEAPHMAAAEKVLAALARCADATHRDTPCVPTYYFRISALDADLVSKRPSTISQHRQLGDAFKKLKVGVPRPAVEADLVRRGIDPKLLDADFDSPLPEPMQEKPVMLELTELYLDERSFYEHAGSRDYLDAYGEALKPGLQNTQTTIRLGTPTSEIADNILGPMLDEKVVLIPTGCELWRRPEAKPDAGSFLSMDASGSVDEVVGKLPASLREDSTTCVGFAHPLRDATVRVLCFLPDLPSPETLQDLRAIGPRALEVHCDKTRCDTMRQAIASASLDSISVIRSIQSGYIIHGRAHEVMEECGTH